jgi:hypothetical protein
MSQSFKSKDFNGDSVDNSALQFRSTKIGGEAAVIEFRLRAIALTRIALLTDDGGDVFGDKRLPDNGLR